MQMNSIKQLLSSPGIKVVEAADFYLPDESWESIFKFLINDDNHRCLKSLSIVSKQFLSITNRLLFSLAVYNPTLPFLPSLFNRFSSLNSLDLTCYKGDLNTLLCQISLFPLNLKSLDLSCQPTIPTNGLRVLSQNITTLISLTCSFIESLHSTDLFFIADCFPLLEELDLSYPIELQNHESLLSGIEVLSSALFKLRKVNLTSHRYINDQSLFHLFKNWKLLEEAIILFCRRITDAGIAFALRERPTLRSLSFSSYFVPEDCAKLFAVSPQLKSLCFTSNSWLKDESIKIFASIFPNLQLLDLSYCSNIPEERICQVLRSCSEIRQLNLAQYSRMNLRGMNFEVPKLEVLNLSRTGVDDEELYVISKSCRGLLQLLLERCCNVTEKGVKHVVENCTKLREINLMGCDKVHPNVVASMVLSRPSLRKIIAPAHYCFSDRERELFSRQRCLVCYS
ncbi:F-box/LRR-repeat protein [Trifolium repens]|nr:F-box/LRR-repeat protein [Trifolium repens]